MLLLCVCVQASSNKKQRFDIAAGPAEQTLKIAANQGQFELVFASDLVVGYETTVIKGRYQPSAALDMMLAGIPLAAVPVSGSTVFGIVQTKMEDDLSGEENSADQTLSSTNEMNLSKNKNRTIIGGFVKVLITVAATAVATSNAQEEDEIFELSPFSVDASQDDGYRATSTLAGSRISTNLKDVGSAVTVVTKEFLDDIGAVDNETLLAYTPGTEVGGTQGNYTGAGNGISVNERGNFNNPNQNTRVRGLARADNTRNFFLTDVPWDGYIVDRVDMQRGPNAILFGLGSPAGIVNATTQDADFTNKGQAEFRFGSYGSVRGSLRKNFVILEDELSAKVAVVNDRQKFRQDPAFDNDERIYVAAKWQPAFLKGDNSRFTAKANFESGKVKSNRPRTVTPKDNITPFFNAVGRVDDGAPGYGNPSYPETSGVGMGTWDPIEVRDSQGEWGTGQLQPTVEVDGESVQNPFYIPAIGNYAQNFGGPLFIFDSPTGGLTNVMVTELPKNGGIGPDGEIDNTLALPFARMTSIANYTEYADNANLEWADYGQYKHQHLSDPTIFNFYDQLIDGNNKNEWADWDVLNVSMEQTFFGDRLGFELAYFDQSYNDGRVGLTNKDEIYIDTNSHLADGSVNPNEGRPFISDSMQGGNRVSTSERDSVRFTAFGEFDFRDKGDNVFTRFLGKHRFTGLKSEESLVSDIRDFHRYRMEDAYFELTKDQTVTPDKQVRWTDNINLINTTHYLGGSLLDASSASGANISNLGALHMPEKASVYMWDTTWSSTVDPAGEWDNDGTLSTQSENPDNYIGWSTYEFDVLNSQEGNNMDRMTTQGILSGYDIKTEAAVWQGWFLNDSIVAMYGWREDKVDTRNLNAPEQMAADGFINGYKDVSGSAYNLDFDPTKEGGQSTSFSIVTHVNALPGMDWMPFNMSLSYNTSENFKPGAGRRDMFGHDLAAPFGETTDKSIFISTKDDRFSLKITDYETKVFNDSSGYIDGTWFVGRFVAWGENWRNVHKHNIFSGFTLDNVSEDQTTNKWRYQMKDPNGVFDQAFEDKAVADWRLFTDAIQEEFPDYMSAWGIEGLGTDVKEYTSQDPAGLSYTQDAVSRGQEYEFNAKITSNWNLMMNASKTEAIRNNVGGEAMISWVAFVEDWFTKSNAGDIRIWGAGGTSIKSMWNSTFRSKYALTELLEGTATPEVRKWRFNALTRYDFKEGGLKGISVGGGVRWQDDVVLGYRPFLNEDGSVNYDLNDPFLGPDDMQVDFFASYKRKIGDNLRWKVQLNVRNLFADDKLIPISTQVDGSTAAYRIPSDRTWTITNTLEF